MASQYANSAGTLADPAIVDSRPENPSESVSFNSDGVSGRWIRPRDLHYPLQVKVYAGYSRKFHRMSRPQYIEHVEFTFRWCGYEFRTPPKMEAIDELVIVTRNYAEYFFTVDWSYFRQFYRRLDEDERAKLASAIDRHSPRCCLKEFPIKDDLYIYSSDCSIEPCIAPFRRHYYHLYHSLIQACTC